MPPQSISQNPNMNQMRRLDEIQRRLLEAGNVEVRALAQNFGVSEATVRRDLRRMADNDQLELVYGGAVLPRKGNYSIRSRQARNMEAKRIIGRLAATLVQDESSIFLDSGTTCGCMVPGLRQLKRLSIITNSNLVAAEIGEHTEFNVLQLGGKFRYERMDSVGPFAQMLIEQLSGYRAFLGADGLDLSIGMTSTDIDTAHLYRAVIEHASESTLLIDHTKFNAPTLYKIGDIASINRLVTDRTPPQPWVQFFEEHDIDLITPEQSGGKTE